ncbi:hypothetical protein B0H13DRAFT_1935255 [Mycena leptocephala]|nr:hypothetical protein B0H13DRAFT_1935255 [Mycena leptocephala]
MRAAKGFKQGYLLVSSALVHSIACSSKHAQEVEQASIMYSALKRNALSEPVNIQEVVGNRDDEPRHERLVESAGPGFRRYLGRSRNRPTETGFFGSKTGEQAEAQNHWKELKQAVVGGSEDEIIRLYG